MKLVVQIEHSASSSQSKHEGESSFGLCDRLSRTRDNSQRQLPTDHDYAVSTREYQTDQSSLKTAPTAARSVFGKRQRQRQRQKQPHRFGGVDTVTPYQTNALIEGSLRPLLLHCRGQINLLEQATHLRRHVYGPRILRVSKGAENISRFSATAAPIRQRSHTKIFLTHVEIRHRGNCGRAPV